MSRNPRSAPVSVKQRVMLAGRGRARRAWLLAVARRLRDGVSARVRLLPRDGAASRGVGAVRARHGRCVKCHQAPTQWYALPQRLVDRAKLLGRRRRDAREGRLRGPGRRAVPGSAPVQRRGLPAVPRREPEGHLGLPHPHRPRRAREAQRLVRLVPRPDGAPVETRGNALSLMSQCFTCHGTAEQPKASAECGVCHPADYELLPKSHTRRQVGEAARTAPSSKADPKQCEMCHKKAFCDDCHGLADAASGGMGQGSHGARGDRAAEPRGVLRSATAADPTCARCATTRPTTRRKGTWVKQHFIEVRNRGAATVPRVPLAGLLHSVPRAGRDSKSALGTKPNWSTRRPHLADSARVSSRRSRSGGSPSASPPVSATRSWLSDSAYLSRPSARSRAASGGQARSTTNCAAEWKQRRSQPPLTPRAHDESCVHSRMDNPVEPSPRSSA